MKQVGGTVSRISPKRRVAFTGRTSDLLLSPELAKPLQLQEDGVAHAL
jgi:hypothetical protein